MACLGENTLSAFLGGALDEAQVASVEAHLEAGGAVALTGESGVRFLLDQDGPGRLAAASEGLRLNDKMLAELRKQAAATLAAAG
jgi:hypothetical protein